MISSKYQRRPGPNKRPKICKKSPPKTKHLRLTYRACIFFNHERKLADAPTFAKFVNLQSPPFSNALLASWMERGFAWELSTWRLPNGNWRVVLLWGAPPSPFELAAGDAPEERDKRYLLQNVQLYNATVRDNVALVTVYPNYERA